MADSTRRDGSGVDPVDPSTPEDAAEEFAPDGANLGREDLPDLPDDVELTIDDVEAEELTEAGDVVDDTPGEADPEDVQIDDEEQLEQATATARAASSSKPVKRNQTIAPVKKAKPTPKRDEARTVEVKRTTPPQFVRQSVGELKKVVWPTAATHRQYFVVVLIFVLFIMAFVAGLDALFGWLLLLWLS